MFADVADDGESDDVLAGARVTLTRDHACFRALAWDVVLHAPVTDWDALARELEGAGCSDESRLPGDLHDFQLAGGHRLLVVRQTGRLQLRLHYRVPAPDRRWTALFVAEGLARLVGEGR